MIDLTAGLVCGFVELEVLLVGRHVAVDKLDLGAAATKFFLQGLAGLVEDVAVEDVCAGGVELAD